MFQTYAPVPEQGGRAWYGGGLVEMEGRVVWKGVNGGVYLLDKENSKWERKIDEAEYGATLAVYGRELLAVGGDKDNVYHTKVMVWRGGRWSLMSDMLVGCRGSCVVSVGGGGLVVMGGVSDGLRHLADVQVFDGRTQTWHFGQPLPKRCYEMSAVVHGDLVFVMGGRGMARAVWCANINDLVR